MEGQTQQAASTDFTPHHQNSDATQLKKRPNRPAPKKQGMDRRLKVRDAAFKE